MRLFYLFLAKPLGESSAVHITEVDNTIDGKKFHKEELTVYELKKLIWKEYHGNEVGSNQVNQWVLWKVEDLIEGREKWKELEKINDNTETFIINELKGSKLASTMKLIDVFDVVPEGLINILVQTQPWSVTTVSSMYIPSDEFKTEIKSKVIKTFPHINPLLINKLVYMLALIWHVEELEGGSQVPHDNPVEELENGSQVPQDDPYSKLKMEPSFFKINLPRGITEKTSKTVDLCLPSYDNSGMSYYNPFYDDPQFKETVSLVQGKIRENPGDVIVLAGVSGGGKTSTAFGIATQLWSIYIDFSPSMGTYGDHVGEELRTIKNMNPKFEDNSQRSESLHILNTVILSRGLLLLKMLIEEKISTPKEWLFAQLQMKEYRIRKILRSEKNLVDVSTMNDIIYYINACLRIDRLTLIFDEAQVLCTRDYGEYKGVRGKKLNLLRAYIEILTIFPVTCLIAGTYMHMANGISLVTGVGKPPALHAHIVLKLPFLSPDDVLRNLDAVINLTDVTPKTRDCLGYILKGRPRNCASFVRHLILNRVSENITKDQEIQRLLCSWFEDISVDMAKYLRNACAYQFNPETAIIDVIRLRVFYVHKFEHVIKLLQHSIIPCQSPDSIMLRREYNESICFRDSYFEDFYKIKINTDLESYLVSSIEVFLLDRKKTLVDVFVDDIIRLNNISSIGNEFYAVFITAMIQKRGNKVRDELDKWKNGQEFNLPSWITPTMRFMTTSNLSGSVPITEYIDNTACYRTYGIQPDRFSGSNVVISFEDDEQSVVLLSASCTVSAGPIKRSKIKEQVFKSCMKFQYMEKTRKRKSPEIEDHEEEFSWRKEECLETGLGGIPANKEDNSEEKGEDEDDQDSDHDNLNYDLKYIKNTEGYHVSRVPKFKDYHEKIKSSTENQNYIYVSVELPRRAGKERPELFRFNEYGDLVIIVDDRNMKYVFGSAIEALVERISYKENQ